MLWGNYRRLSHTVLCCIVSNYMVSAFLSKMFDVGDLPVGLLTFGNCVLKAEWLSGLWNYTYVFYVFLRFFQNPNTWLFTFFWVVAHVFSNTGLRQRQHSFWSLMVFRTTVNTYRLHKQSSISHQLSISQTVISSTHSTYVLLFRQLEQKVTRCQQTGAYALARAHMRTSSWLAKTGRWNDLL